MKDVFDHEEQTRKAKMSPEVRLRYHQTYSAPIMAKLKTSMERQLNECEAELNSSLGKALCYWLERGPLEPQ